MNALVVGSGAVGSLLAWVLARAGWRVTIVRRGLAGEAEAARPLVVVRSDGVELSAAVDAVAGPDRLSAPPDLVVVAVKAFDVAAALASLPDWPSATLLTVQNGVGAEELALAARPSGGLVAGSLTASVELRPDGRVGWLRRGGIGLAAVRDPGAGRLDELAGAFDRAGLPARRYPDWSAMKWSKLVANLVANATSALLDRDPGAIYADPRLFALERAQLREALAVMRRRGLRPVALPGANVPLLARAVALPAALGRPLLARVVGGARGGKSPSLRLHLDRAGGPSEVTWLNGAVAREGERLGVPTPVNAALARLLEAAAADPALRDELRAAPQRLLDEVAASAPTPRAEGLGADGTG